MRRGFACLVLAAAAACAAWREGVPLDAGLMAELSARVEAARGLELPPGAAARVVDPAQVRGILDRELAAAFHPGEVEALAFAAAALGLVPADTDLRQTLLEFSASGLAGFYSVVGQRLYLVGRPRGPLGTLLRRPARPSELDESVLVHELTHALQDAHTPLLVTTLGIRGQDDLLFGLGSLLEGEALWVSFRDAELRGAGPPPSPRSYANDLTPEWAEAEYPDVPRILRDPLVLQYTLGYALATAVAARGGTAALDAALADPPLSSQALLHPERWLDPARRERPVFLELPERAPVGCSAPVHNTLGELGLRVWLAERRGAASERERPADGWEGDRLAVWRCGERAAFAWLVRFASPREAREFAVVAEDGLRATGPPLAGQPGLEVDGSDVWITAGVSAEELASLKRGVTASAPRDLSEWLSTHPDVLERARLVRAPHNG